MKVYKRKKREKGSLLLIYAVLLFFAFLFLFPFLWNFISASWGTAGTGEPSSSSLFDVKWMANLEKLNEVLPDFWLNVFNTIFVSSLAASTQIFFCTMAGFAFARYDFKGRKLLFQFMLITLAIPSFVNMIPFFRMMVFFRWTNTYLPLFIPGMANAFGILYMTQFIRQGVPRELVEAARIDGLGEMQILLNICFPLVRPGLMLLGVFVFIYTWNDFVVARVMLYEKSTYTLAVALSFLNLSPGTDFGVKMFANILNIVPMLVLFLFFSKKFFDYFDISYIVNREL